MKAFKSTLGIDMSITTLIIGTLCQNRKGDDTGYDHQHLKDKLQKHDDNSPGCYQKSDEINNGKDGDYQALACTQYLGVLLDRDGDTRNQSAQERMNMMASLTIPCHPSHNCTIMA